MERCESACAVLTCVRIAWNVHCITGSLASSSRYSAVAAPSPLDSGLHYWSVGNLWRTSIRIEWNSTYNCAQFLVCMSAKLLQNILKWGWWCRGEGWVISVETHWCFQKSQVKEKQKALEKRTVEESLLRPPLTLKPVCLARPIYARVNMQHVKNDQMKEPTEVISRLLICWNVRNRRGQNICRSEFSW